MDALRLSLQTAALAAALALPAAAQDYSPHLLNGSAQVPKLPLWLRGYYSIQLDVPSPGRFKMELCPIESTGVSKRAERRVHKHFLRIAKQVCGGTRPSLAGELDWSVHAGHAGAGLNNITGEFTCDGR